MCMMTIRVKHNTGDVPRKAEDGDNTDIETMLVIMKMLMILAMRCIMMKTKDGPMRHCL